LNCTHTSPTLATSLSLLLQHEKISVIYSLSHSALQQERKFQKRNLTQNKKTIKHTQSPYIQEEKKTTTLSPHLYFNKTQFTHTGSLLLLEEKSTVTICFNKTHTEKGRT